MDIGDSLDTAISENVTVGAATAPPLAVPAPNNTVVTIRSAQSVADILAYNISACMARTPLRTCMHAPDTHRAICSMQQLCMSRQCAAEPCFQACA